MATLKTLENHHIEILRLVAQGFTNKEIAQRLVYTTTSVETMRSHMIKHAGVRNTAQLVSWAYENGILQLQEVAA